MKKFRVYPIIVLLLFALGACVATAHPSPTPSITYTSSPYITYTFSSTPTATYTPTPSPTNRITYTPSPHSVAATSVIPTLPCIGCTPIPPTATTTLNYAKLGLPSPTFTPTLDYINLASHYLTPFTPEPTETGFFPTWTATPTPADILANIATRKLPHEWKPTPPPLATDYCGISYNLFDRSQQACKPHSLSIYMQAATDLINSIDGDSKLYIQYIDSWAPNGRYIFGETWLVKDDIESFGQPVWLASIPVYFREDTPYCCGQIILLFEKQGDLYKPAYLVAAQVTRQSGITIALMDDLNKDGYQEVVLQSTTCGSACGTEIEVGEWDGQKWRNEGWLQSEMDPKISALDLYGDGNREILVRYTSYAASKYDSWEFPDLREIMDTYAWDGQYFSLVDEVRAPSHVPSTNLYPTLGDIYNALKFKNAERALRLATPAMADISQSCNRERTYIGIETMLAYGLQNNNKEMQSVYSKLEKYCDKPDNGFIYAARIFWQAFQQSHDTISACEAMSRFIIDYRDPATYRFLVDGASFFDGYVNLSAGYCPFNSQ